MQSAKGLRERSTSGAVWGIIDSVAQQFLSLVIFVVLGRMLSPDLFGVVSTSLVLVFLMRSTILNAISSSLVAAKDPDERAYDTAFWLLAIISSIFVLILWVSAGPISKLYNISSFKWVIRSISFLVLFFGLSYAHYGWARKHFLFKSLAIRNIAGVAIGGLVGLAVAMAGYGLIALVLNQIVAALVSLGLLWFFVPWRPKLTFDGQWAKWMLKNAAPLGGTQALQYAAQNFDTAVVTYVAGPFAGGLYGAAKRITLALQLSIWMPLSAVSLPAFAELTDNDPRLASMVLRSSGIVMAITAPAFLGVSALAEPLMLALFGAKWAAAAPVLSVLAAFSLVMPSSGLLQMLAFSRGMGKTLIISVGVQTILAFSLALNMRGHSTAFIALVLSAPSLIGFFVLVQYVLRHARIKLISYILAISRPLMAAIIMFFAVSQLPLQSFSPWISLLFGTAVGALVYVPTLYFASKATFTDIMLMAEDILRPILRSFKRRA